MAAIFVFAIVTCIVSIVVNRAIADIRAADAQMNLTARFDKRDEPRYAAEAADLVSEHAERVDVLPRLCSRRQLFVAWVHSALPTYFSDTFRVKLWDTSVRSMIIASSTPAANSFLALTVLRLV